MKRILLLIILMVSTAGYVIEGSALCIVLISASLSLSLLANLNFARDETEEGKDGSGSGYGTPRNQEPRMTILKHDGS